MRTSIELTILSELEEEFASTINYYWEDAHRFRQLVSSDGENEDELTKLAAALDGSRRHLRTLEGLAAKYERRHQFSRQIEEIFDDFNRFEHDHTTVLAKARRQELIDALRLYELSMADLFSLDESEWENLQIVIGNVHFLLDYLKDKMDVEDLAAKAALCDARLKLLDRVPMGHLKKRVSGLDQEFVSFVKTSFDRLLSRWQQPLESQSLEEALTPA